jgi:hypothetical protein
MGFTFYTLFWHSIKEQNGVAGTLPFELSRLQNLQSLLLEEGILTGTIPTELGDVGTLEYVVSVAVVVCFVVDTNVIV